MVLFVSDCTYQTGERKTNKNKNRSVEINKSIFIWTYKKWILCRGYAHGSRLIWASSGL